MAGRAPATMIAVTATVNGTPNTQIGTLNSNIDNRNADDGKFMSAVFQLNAANRNLMSDAMGCQFRYVQIITGYNGAPVKAADGTVLKVPWVDFPRGGYTGFGGAEDNAPFYENDDGTGPFPNYPRYSDNFPENPFTTAAGFANKPVHEEANGIVRAIDVPRQPVGVTVTFETYIVYVNPEMRADAPAMFQVLAGFGWSAAFAADGPSFIETTGNNGITDIRTAGGGDGAAIDRINTALANSGFNGQFAWQATAQGNLMPCPEPSSLSLLAIGGGGLLLCFRRRKLAVAKSA
jgi:hypothetical protein